MGLQVGTGCSCFGDRAWVNEGEDVGRERRRGGNTNPTFLSVYVRCDPGSREWLSALLRLG